MANTATIYVRTAIVSQHVVVGGWPGTKRHQSAQQKILVYAGNVRVNYERSEDGCHGPAERGQAIDRRPESIVHGCMARRLDAYCIQAHAKSATAISTAVMFYTHVSPVTPSHGAPKGQLPSARLSCFTRTCRQLRRKI